MIGDDRLSSIERVGRSLRAHLSRPIMPDSRPRIRRIGRSHYNALPARYATFRPIIPTTGDTPRHGWALVEHQMGAGSAIRQDVKSHPYLNLPEFVNVVMSG